MISENLTAKTLVDKAGDYLDSINVMFIAEGETETNVANIQYVKEKLLNNKTHTVGLAGNSSDVQRPIYQLTVFTPKSMSRFDHLPLVDNIVNEFKKSELLLQGGQNIQVQTVDASELMFGDTQLITAISVNLTVFATN